MNWNQIHDWAFDHRCQERRKYGSCNCSKGKGKVNPCETATEMMDSALALERGEQPQHPPEAIAKWIKTRMCSLGKSGRCNHQGCINAEPLVKWIMEQGRLVAA